MTGISDCSLPEDLAAALPKRTAYALYALALCAEAKHCSGPFSASEIAFYDPGRPSVMGLGSALSHALKLGLCDRVAPMWWATPRGNSLRRHLEARVLEEQLQEQP